MTESDLLSRLRDSDAGAFDEIFRRWYEPAVRSAARIVRDSGVAEDLAQDVFLELWKRRETIPSNSSEGAYLLQSVRNRALNYLRHMQVQRKNIMHIEALTGPAEFADAKARSDELQNAATNAIAGLPPRTREVFIMSRERGLKYTEIAEILGITVKAVEANMSRALKSLREKLSPWLTEGVSG